MSAVVSPRSATAAVIAAATLVVALAGCGTDGTTHETRTPAAASTPAAPTSPAPSPSESPVPSPPPPFDLESQRRATAAYPDKASLPDGWVQVDPTKALPEYPGDPEYCGVRLEAQTAPGSAIHLYEAGDSGPYVLQYTFVLPEGVAASVLDELAPAVRACIAKGRDDAGRVFAAKQAPTVGNESVSAAFVADAGGVSQVTVFRRGDVLVALVGFDPAGIPPLPAIATIAKGVDARLSASSTA